MGTMCQARRAPISSTLHLILPSTAVSAIFGVFVTIVPMGRSLLAGLIVAMLAAIVSAKPLPRKERNPDPTNERTPRVVLDTNHGRIVLELYPDKAPLTVKNFLQYVDEGHYNGMIFHRTINNFMIQGGGFVPGMTEKKTRDSIKLEDGNGLSNKRGAIAMARTGDPNSATAQFF